MSISKETSNFILSLVTLLGFFGLSAYALVTGKLEIFHLLIAYLIGGASGYGLKLVKPKS